MDKINDLVNYSVKEMKQQKEELVANIFNETTFTKEELNAMSLEQLEKLAETCIYTNFNKSHDKLGRFASKGGAGGAVSQEEKAAKDRSEIADIGSKRVAEAEAVGHKTNPVKHMHLAGDHQGAVGLYKLAETTTGKKFTKEIEHHIKMKEYHDKKFNEAYAKR